MADKKGVPLESIAGFPESARTRLAELWITTAEDLVEYLGWHGVEAAVRVFEAHDPSVGEALLLEARAAAINLLVVGGYSRSRLRELMFGGVTGHLLAESDIPVFMVH